LLELHTRSLNIAFPERDIPEVAGDDRQGVRVAAIPCDVSAVEVQRPTLFEVTLLRIPRQRDLLVGFTIQPVLFVLLFVYVFGGAIKTPGFDYVDFLMPGIIVQSIVFGGFVTALGLADDLKKGLIDRFRSLPMTRSALLTGRTLGDVVTNIFQLIVMFTVGLLIGFNFSSSVGEVVAGILLLLLIGYAFSWVFAFIGLSSSSPEASNAYGFTILFPVTFVSSAFVPSPRCPAGSSR
jgi:ABC-type multidrug transport system permease subunit